MESIDISNDLFVVEIDVNWDFISTIRNKRAFLFFLKLEIENKKIKFYTKTEV